MSNVWTEWDALTQFLEGARAVLGSERDHWGSLASADQVTTEAKANTGLRHYAVALTNHLAAVDEDEVTLYSAVLIHTYALTESAACRKLGIDSRSTGGDIATWGTRLLDTQCRGWDDVLGGSAGAVEVAQVRDALAHGTRRAPGKAVGLEYQQLREYRDRLRCLLQVGGVGKLSSDRPA